MLQSMPTVYLLLMRIDIMKGFNIKINGRALSAGVNDVGMSFIFLNCMDGECRITVRGVDHIVHAAGEGGLFKGRADK